MRLKALRTFKVGDTNKVVNIGDEFESKNGAHYEKLGMATPVHGVPQVANPVKAAVAKHFQDETDKMLAGARPTSPTGGATGAAKPLLSSQAAPAPEKRRYTKRGAAPK